MQLGRTVGDGGAGDLDAFLDRMCVRTFLPSTLVKAAEFAVGDADVRVVEVAVDVLIRRQPVFFAADMVGQFAESVEVRCLVQRHAFGKRQPLSILDLFRYVLQLGIEGKFHALIVSYFKIITKIGKFMI